MNPQDERTSHPYYEREGKKDAPIIFDHDAELREMKENRPADGSQRKQRTHWGETGHKEQDARNQLDHSRTIAAPGFLADLGENIDRLLGSRELEEQGLQQDHRDNAAGYPAGDSKRS